ncbi:hypothetical protein MAR_035887 [Mya arenaria]|uniref:Uncharacterized protein n=1 Tax=Mya arenaria TaxID=6604 RepID=A0ABY7EUE3_MYAAR|nr:hypothetical protein MAR_035887 [Mya arenaria]
MKTLSISEWRNIYYTKQEYNGRVEHNNIGTDHIGDHFLHKVPFNHLQYPHVTCLSGRFCKIIGITFVTGSEISRDEHMVVAAIGFGSTYSGYAFKF